MDFIPILIVILVVAISLLMMYRRMKPNQASQEQWMSELDTISQRQKQQARDGQVTDNPDLPPNLDEMSPMEMMKWMEDISKRSK